MKIALNKGLYGVCAAAFLLLAGACNTTDTPTQEGAADYSGTAVRSFSLQENDKVLNNMDSVFFSIDLVNGTIFNADSLPTGTDISALAVKMQTDACAECKFHMTSVHGNDTVVDFLTSPDEKLNFTKPVSLYIKSYNGSYERTYEIKVNVHTQYADSLQWSDAALPPMPVSDATEMRTVSFHGTAYTLAATRNGMELYHATDLFKGKWEKTDTDLPADVQVSSLTASHDGNTLYILSASGALLSSTDGATFTATGTDGWEAITAAYPPGVLGLKKGADGSYTHVAYPAGSESAAQSDFPVSGYSGSVLSSTDWAVKPQVLIAGGRNASGVLTGSAWAYDGSRWAKVGTGLPAAEGYAIARYTIARTDTLSWVTSRQPALIAMGGRNGNNINGKVYVSRDMGMTWGPGDISVQLPKDFPALSGADLLVFEYQASVVPKAIRPITEWDVPFLFLFGGRDKDSRLQFFYRVGAINALRFKPLQ